MRKTDNLDRQCRSKSEQSQRNRHCRALLKVASRSYRGLFFCYRRRHQRCESRIFETDLSHSITEVEEGSGGQMIGVIGTPNTNPQCHSARGQIKGCGFDPSDLRSAHFCLQGISNEVSEAALENAKRRNKRGDY